MTTTRKARTQPEQRLTIIHRLDEIPTFNTEQEEREFWDTHTFSRELMTQATWDPDDPAAPSQARRRG